MANLKEISNMIPTGADDGLPMSDLSNITGLTERDIRKCIEQLRRSGEVICSGVTGYYRPADVFELREYINRMTARAETTFLCLQGARALLRQFDGQMTLRGFFDEQ